MAMCCRQCAAHGTCDGLNVVQMNFFTPHSFSAAMRGAGAIVEAVRAVRLTSPVSVRLTTPCPCAA